ncbi:PIN domain-containing protein [Riemerella anatipestifer]
MAKIDIKNYKIRYSDQFFFDTNVWLLIFGTIANFQKSDQSAYSKFLSDLITRDKPIFITSMVISEFANVLLRHSFRQWQDSNKLVNKKFKTDFVGTTEYNDSVLTIKSSIHSILSIKNVIKVSDNFNGVNMSDIINNFGTIDYNDSYIFHLSKQNNYKIVTNDSDFQSVANDIDIITTRI